MVDRTGFPNQGENEGFDALVKAASQVKVEVERLVEEFDLQSITKRVEEFGRENPVGLAVTALSLGLVAGIVMRVPKHIARH